MTSAVFYHGTIPARAYAILTEGFRDYDVYEGRGDALRGVHPPRGVRIADKPVSSPAKGDAAIVEVVLDERIADELDLVPVVKGDESYRECIVPAAVLNQALALRVRVDDELRAISIRPRFPQSMSNTTRSIEPSKANGARR